MNRFCENKCDKIETEAIVMYFSEHPEEIDKYLTKEEWNNISDEGSLPPLVSERLKKALWNKLFPARNTKRIRLYRKYSVHAAAASLILVVALSWLVQYNTKKRSPLQVVRQVVPLHPRAAGNSDTITWLTKFNITSKTEKILLEDGSVVSLSKNSSIRYPVHFKKVNRNIYLTGEAFFEVAKDRSRPFTVFSGVLSTTALGTSFRIKMTDTKKKHISVQLFTGKVMIRSTRKLNNWHGDIFLSPGQQMAYEGENYPVTVSSLDNDRSVIHTTGEQQAKATPEKREWHFNNSPLTEVLAELSNIFKVSIRFTDSELNKMNFTGSINRSDNLEDVLRLIVQMNGLELNESTDGFTITKTK
ncbi:MAG: FecR domain-containing protein [Bacteroidota bacterium]|nr:FecR domain-containing protein [Bacteroidota bacterium]